MNWNRSLFCSLLLLNDDGRCGWIIKNPSIVLRYRNGIQIGIFNFYTLLLFDIENLLLLLFLKWQWIYGLGLVTFRRERKTSDDFTRRKLKKKNARKMHNRNGLVNVKEREKHFIRFAITLKFIRRQKIVGVRIFFTGIKCRNICVQRDRLECAVGGAKRDALCVIWIINRIQFEQSYSE